MKHDMCRGDTVLEASKPKAGASERRTSDAEFEAQMAVLSELFKDDRASLAQIINGALDSIRVDCQRITCGAGAGDTASMIASSHRLQGTAGNLRANRMIAIASSIERAAEAGAFVAPALVAELARTVDVLGLQIEAYVKLFPVTAAPLSNRLES